MSPFDWFAAGMCVGLGGQWLGMLLVARERQRFYDNFGGRRMGPPKGSYGLPPDHDWRRSFNHENTNPPTGEPPLKLRRSERFTEGRVQRGQGNGGPSTEKPAIVAKPQPHGGRMVGDDLCPPPPSIKPRFPSPRIIREDFLPSQPDGRDPDCVAAWPDCVDGEYDPRCCRFPKSCSCGPR
jgi:hypothetical protein